MSRRKVGIRQGDQGRERQGKCTTYVLPAWLVLPVVLSAWLPRQVSRLETASSFSRPQASKTA
jgi:hypothetical protein